MLKLLAGILKTFVETGTFPFRLKQKKQFKLILNFFLVNAVVCFVLLFFFFAKIKVAIFVIIYEQIIKKCTHL